MTSLRVLMVTRRFWPLVGGAEMVMANLASAMRDLGVESFEDMQRRAAEIEAFLPDLMALACDLIAANPEVRG